MNKFCIPFVLIVAMLCIGITCGASDSADADPTYYTIYFDSNNSSYGDVDYMAITVEEGSTYSANGNVMEITDTIGSTSYVTATPNAPVPPYQYAFDYWSDLGGTVYGDIWITAYFTETLLEYTVTIQSNDISLGDVSVSTITVPAESPIYSYQNELSIGMYSITAEPNMADAQYTYEFDSWQGITNTVSSDMTITAIFTYTLNTYVVNILSNDSSWGTISNNSVTVDYGTSYSTNGNILTIGSYTITATPTVSDAQYRYSFEGWTPYSGTVDYDMDIYAYFSANLKEYTVTVNVASPVYGSVDTPTYTAHYGDIVSVSDNTITIGSDTITATPYSQTTDTTYSFDRWTNVPNSITGDVTITAYFTSSVREYLVDITKNYSDWGKVCYSGTSTEVSELYIPYGSTYSANGDTMTISTSSGNIVLVAIPSNDTVEYDYSFSSWSPVSGTILSDFTLGAFFLRDIQQYSFTINYNPNYGSLNGYNPPLTVLYGSTYSVSGNDLVISNPGGGTIATISPVPTQDTAQYDYEFDHWYPTSGTITGNTTVNANFSRTLNHCVVTFVANDSTYGTVDTQSVTVDYGTSFTTSNNTLTIDNTTITATPSIATQQYQYAFGSWSPSSGTITNNTTITAIFTQSLVNYTVTISSNDSTWGDVDTHSLTVPYGTAFTTLDDTLTIGGSVITATPSQSTSQYSYHLDSWSPSSGTIIGNTSITAMFSRSVNDYTVTIVANDSSWGTVTTSSIYVPYGTNYSSSLDTLTIGSQTITATPTTDTAQYGYEFDSWSPSSGTITDNLTITAIFTQTVQQYSVYVSTNTGGSVDISQITVDYGTTFSTNDNILTVGSTTVTATPDQPTAQFTYLFDYWSPSSGTITGNTTITARFTSVVNTYTVTIVPNDNSYGTVSQSSIVVGYNSLITVSSNQLDISSNLITATPSSPTAEYQYAFDSWSPSSGRVTGDMTITANFSRDIRTYTVSIVPNQSSYGSVDISSVNVLYGTTYTSASNELSIDNQTITATPSSATTQYTYSFDSWSPSSGTITGDTTITATFLRTVNQYTVTIQPNDLTYGTVDVATVTVDYGTSISVNDNVLTIGNNTITATPSTATAQYTYSFDEWSPSSGTVEGTMTVTATFLRTVNQYTVTIVVNEPNWGTVNNNSVTVDYGTSIIPVGNRMYLGSYTITATPSLSDAQYDYLFSSWSPTSGTITGNTTITANFSRDVRTYTVTIAPNVPEWGTVNISSVNVQYGTTFTSSGNTLTIGSQTITATPTTDTAQYGYEFDSWSPSSGTITGNDSISAVFARSLVQYTVTIVSDNPSWGTVSNNSVTVDYGTVASTNGNVLSFGITSVTANPSSATAQYTYSFDEWNPSSTVITADRTITAYFVRTVNQYTVTIVSDNSSWGTVDESSVVVDYGTPFSTVDNVLTIGNNTVTATPSTPTSEYQYSFDYWSPSSGTIEGNNTVTVYFTQELRKYTVSFVVNESGWGSVDTQSISNIEYGTTYSVLDNTLAINGETITATPSTATAQYTYLFSGWSPFSGTITGDTTVMAIFSRTVNQYTVTIVPNDPNYGSVDVNSVTVDYGTVLSSNGNEAIVGNTTVTATPASATVQYSYSFVRWTGASGTVVGNTTITAGFTRTINQYTVTITANDPTYGTVSSNSLILDYGTAYAGSTEIMNIGSYSVIATPSSPSSQYQYAFDSWSPSSGTVNGDITITANFVRSIRTYSISFLVNESGWGSVSDAIISGISYGESYSVSGNTFTVGNDSVSATPSSPTAQYTYSFDYWTPSVGTVTGDMSVTAYFTRTVNQYTITIVSNDSSWGTVDVASILVDYGEVPYTYQNTLILNNTTVTATPSTATVQYTYSFDDWSGATASITGNRTITANFVRIANTYPIHFNVNDAEYGSVVPLTVYATYGDQPTVNGSNILVSGQTITAVPTPATAQYLYTFDSWVGVPSEITGETTVTANFARSIQVYAVNFAKNENAWGSVSTSLITVEYGTAYSSLDNVLTIGSTTVTATPTADTLQYDYGFDLWSPTSGTITGPTVITAMFTRDLVQYTVTIESNDVNWGTVSESTLLVGYGTSFTSQGNVLSIGDLDVIATPTPDTDQYIFTFGNWSPSSGTVTGNVTITANFIRSLAQYTVTITANNPSWGTVSTQSVIVDYGTSIGTNEDILILDSTSVVAIPSTATAQFSYEFDSWTPSTGTITTNTTIVANFVRVSVQYTVDFVVNNAEYGEVDRSSILAEYGSVISVADNELTIGLETVTATPTIATAQYSYSFGSWSPSSGTVNGNMTITANFVRTVNNYIVHIEPNNSYYGSVSASSVIVPYGTSVSTNNNTLSIGETDVTATPTQSNVQYRYVFVAWSQNSGTIIEETTITAIFDREVISYRITISPNNSLWGSVSETSVLAEYGTDINVVDNRLYIETRPLTMVSATPSSATAQYTYSFDHWSMSDTTVTDNMTIIAHFDRVQVSYTVTFQSNADRWGSVSPSSVTVPYGTSYTTSNNEFLIGEYTVVATPSVGDEQYTYSFNNWSRTSGTITENITIFANFGQTVNYYTVTIQTNNGYGTVNYNSVSAPYNSLIVEVDSGRLSIGSTIVTATPNSPTIDRTYWFDGWQYPSGYHSGSAVVENITIIANFDSGIRMYNVSFNPTPAEYGSVSVEYTGTPVGASYPIPYGSTISTSDDTLTISDGTIASAIPSPQDVAYTYIFNNWVVPAYTVTGDMIISANFSRIANTTVSVTVSTPYGHFYVNGIEYTSHTFDVPYPSDVSAIGNELYLWNYVITVDEEIQSEMTEYYFVQWEGIPVDGRVYGGIEISAYFTSNDRYYTVTFNIADGFGTINITTIQVLYNTLLYSENNTIVIGLYTIVATPTEDTDDVTYEFVRWDGVPSSGRILEDTDIYARVMRTVSFDAFNVVEIEHGDVERVWTIPDEYLPLMLIIPIMLLIGMVLLSLNRKSDRDDYESY